MNTTTDTKRCNRIDVIPGTDDYGHRTYFCANCGRDLEVTTTATGYRHSRGDYGDNNYSARDRFNRTHGQA